jgi:hypothetical protein
MDKKIRNWGREREEGRFFLVSGDRKAGHGLLTDAGAGRRALNDGPLARIVEHRSLCQ